MWRNKQNAKIWDRIAACAAWAVKIRDYKLYHWCMSHLSTF